MENHLQQQDGRTPVTTRWKASCGNTMEEYLWQQRQTDACGNKDRRIPVATKTDGYLWQHDGGYVLSDH